MSKKFTKLTSEAKKALKPGQSICEHNIKFTREKNGDGVYEVYFTANGKREHRTVGRESEGFTLKKVELTLQQAKADAIHKRFNLPQGRKNHMSFQEAAAKYIERLKLEGGKNIERKERQLEVGLTPFFKDMALSQINTFDVERYKAESPKRLNISESTVNHYLCVLSHLLNKAEEWGWIQHKTCVIKKYRVDNARITYLTAEQCQALLEAAKTDPYPILYPFIMIGLNTAMRLQEILSIQLKHIDLTRRIIYIPEAKAGSREQPITRQLADYLTEYLQMVPQDQPWLFPSNRSNTGHYETIERPFRRAVAAIGLDPKLVVRHTLRHTAITHLVQAGVDLPTVMRISGHKSLQMVQRYAHQNGAHIDTAMDILEGKYKATP